MSGKVEPFTSNPYLTLSCNICNKHFNGRKPYNDHLQSNNHKKKLKDKAILDLESQVSHKSEVRTVHSDGVYKDLEVKNIIDDLQSRKLILSSEANKTDLSTGWKPVESLISPTLFAKTNNKELEQFYVECAICQLYFTSQKSAYAHFNSDEHKRKVAHHKEIEELYNSVKNIDLQEIVENLCEMPPLNPLEKNMKSSITNATMISSKQKTLENSCEMPPLNPLEKNVNSNITNTTKTSSKQRTPVTSGSKLPPGDHKERKLQPGCEICGITSFPSVISSLNHLSTTEHFRKVAMQSEAAKLNTKFSEELSFISPSAGTSQKSSKKNSMDSRPASPHIISVNPDCYRTFKQEEKRSDSIPLNPIGYERKQRQHQQPNYNLLEEPICLPEMYNFDYNNGTSSTKYCFAEVLLDPSVQKHETSIEGDISLGGQYLPQKCVFKPFPRLAATFPQNDVNIEQKNLHGVKIINLGQDISF